MKNRIYLTFITVFLVISGCGNKENSGRFELAKKGRSKAAIVIASDANEIILEASQELQLHILKATGAELPVKKADLVDPDDPGLFIMVGTSPLTSSLGIDIKNLAFEEFIIRITGNRIVLAGSDDMNTDYFYREAGTRLAVYTFLHDYLGIRWYYPGEMGTVIPQQKSIYLDSINKKVRPRFSPRETNLIAGPGLPFTDKDIRQWAKRTRHGGAPLHAGHSFYKYMTVEDFNQHPEYFSMNKEGKRFRSETNNLVQLCLSNEKLVDVIVEKAREYFNISVSNQYFTVMPGDSFGSTCCQCKSCQALYDHDRTDMPAEMRQSRYVWGFVNKVAAKLIDEFPDRMIFCCAYGGYRLPLSGMKFEKNVVTGPTVNRVGFGYQLGDAKKGIIPWVGVVNNLIIDENYHHGIIDNKYREYGYHIWDGVPRLCYHRIAEEIRQRVEFDIVRGEPYDLYVPFDTIEGKPVKVYHMWMIDNLNTYLIAEMNFDPSYNVDTIVNNYCRDLYGPAADEVHAFFDLVEQRWTRAPAELDIHEYKEPMTKLAGKMMVTAWTKVFSQENMDELSGLLESAKEKVSRKKYEVYRRRVELLDESFLQYMLKKQKEGLERFK